MQRIVAQIGLLIGLGVAVLWLVRFSAVLSLVVILTAALFVVTIWLLRYSRRLVIWCYNKPILRNVIDFVCFITREQPPVGAKDAANAGELLLRTENDFAVAWEQINQFVRGQANAVDAVLRHLRDNVVLRQQRISSVSTHSPLGTFLIVGPEGIGKRYFARILAKMLFRTGGTVLLELDKLGTDPGGAIFGTKGSPGILTEAVRRQPYQLVLIERFETAPTSLAHILRDVFQRGVGVDGSSNRSLSFVNCVFILTATSMAMPLAKLAHEAESHARWREQAVDMLSAEGGCDPALLASLTDIVCFQPLSDASKAEIISMLMVKECNSYEVSLDYVDPEIVVSEVCAIRDEVGLALTPDRIKKVLREPLVLASERRSKRMALKVIPIESPLPV